MIFYHFMDDFKRAEFGHVIGRIGRDNAPMTNMASALNWLRHAYQAQKSMPLQELVLEFRNFRAKALLGIATDGEKFPNPDYRKSTSDICWSHVLWVPTVPDI
jgi:hypothetical protein